MTIRISTLARASLVLPVILWSLPLLADVAFFTTSRDVTLHESSNGSLASARSHFLCVGNTGQASSQNTRRALLAFDLAGLVPAGSTVTGVTLTLYMGQTNAGTVPVRLHEVLADWGEGMSFGSGGCQSTSAADGDATWLYRSYDTANPTTSPAWTNPGGDLIATPTATINVGGTGFYTWSTAAMVSAVQGWLDNPAQNFGWMLVGSEGGGATAKRFESKDSPQGPQRPLLTIEFVPLNPTTTGACCFDDTSCQELTEADCMVMGGVYRGDGVPCGPDLCPLVLQPYLDPLPIPAVAQPSSGSPGGAAAYQISMTEFQQQLHAQLPPTTVWGYGGTFPGPTVEAWRDEPVSVTWINDLRDAQGNLRTSHYLPVDLCPHGPNFLGPTARAVVHLHGGHVPAAFDGYPESTILPGESVLYQYPNHQRPATLWYHDHALGITRLNVIMGLAGFYLIRDQQEVDLGLPAGEYEIPLVIQDRSFKPDGSFQYPAAWQDHFFGDKILVNGKVWPFLVVRKGKYRFRVLNGSNSRTYTLSLSNGASLWILGTEGGLLPSPGVVPAITLAPGERVDMVIDFAGMPAGTSVELVNSAPAPFQGQASGSAGVIPEVMQFIVVNLPGHTAPLPFFLPPIETLDESDAVQSRTFDLRQFPEPCAGSRWLINGLHWDAITEFPRLGTTEVWSFVNRSGVSHPMHLHLVSFQVLDRQPFAVQMGQVVTTGPAVPRPFLESGWKDTVMAHPLEITRVIARFEDYEGLFAYHCHVLEHEDHEMMRQFQTVAPEFLRGDVNADGARNVADAFALLDHAFGGATISCRQAADANDDEAINVADVTSTLAYLFQLGPAPPAPFVTCGPDPTPGPLNCTSFAPCP